MRWTAVLLALMLIFSGCLSGGSGAPGDDKAQTQALNTSSPSNRTATNGSDGNATYLKDSDYNQTHVHDYWPGNSTEKVLMDDTVQTETMISVFYTAFSPFFRDPKTGVGTVWFSLPNGTFVPQGTGKLTIQVDSTSALKRGQQALYYQPANSAEYTQMQPKGAQAEWTIDVKPEMADLPHAKSTRWDFRLEAQGAGSVLDGEINVKIVAHKTREVEAWPEHPDFWNKGKLANQHLATMNGTFDRLNTFATEWATGGQQSSVTFPEGTIVPPETKVLLVKFWYALDNHPKNNANADVTLLVKEGSSSSYFEWQDDNIVRQEQGFKMFAIPVDGASWDSPYAEKSNWAFRVYSPLGVRNPSSGDTMFYFGIGESGSGNVTIDATAYRVIPPWLQSQMSGEDPDEDRARALR